MENHRKNKSIILLFSHTEQNVHFVPYTLEEKKKEVTHINFKT